MKLNKYLFIILYTIFPRGNPINDNEASSLPLAKFQIFCSHTTKYQDIVSFQILLRGNKPTDTIFCRIILEFLQKNLK